MSEPRSRCSRAGDRAAYLVTLAGVLLLADSCLAQAEKPVWELGIGVSGISFADYIGADERTHWVLPFPFIVYRGDVLQIDRQSVTSRIFASERVKLDFSFSGSLPVNSDDNAAREDMPDLDPILEVGPTLQFTLHENRSDGQRIYLDLPVRAAIASDLRETDHIGWISNPSINYEKSFASNSGALSFEASLGPVFGDARYHAYFYDVEPAFATPTRPRYQSASGFGGWRLALGVSRRYGDFWYGGFLRYMDIAQAEFADSPLVQQDYALTAGIAVAWIFARSQRTVAEPE